MAKAIKERFLSHGKTVSMPKDMDKPFIRRMLDPSSPTIEIDGREASVRTTSMDGRLFPTVVPQEQADGSYALVELKPRDAYDLAMETGNFIQFDSDEEAEEHSILLSEEAGERRRQYKNNQNFIAQGGKGLGDVEFRADMESAISDDSLSRLGYELYRRGIIDLTAIPMDMGRTVTRKSKGKRYHSLGQESSNLENFTPTYKSMIRTQNPLTREEKYEKPIAAFLAGEGGLGRPRGTQELVAGHELRHAAMTYLMNNTDISKNELFENFDGDLEEDIMDKIDYSKIAEGKRKNNPEFTSMRDKFDDDIKIDPKYIGGRKRLEVVNDYATQALKDLDVPEYTEQKKPGILKKLFGMEQGGIMMAQQGKMPLPMEEATSAPQGGGPKAANPAAQPEGLGAPTGAPAPAGSSDPRDEAIKEVAQKMQNRSAPASIPAEVPQMAGLGAPMQEVPMMAKGGMADDSGMSVMIGLGAPSADYEKAAEGNPPPGATEEEVADDQLVLLSEGELVVPANVVRYHGLGAYEGMRRDALMGLQDMETNGQIEYVSGGAEKADKVDDDGGIIKANQGTYLGNPSTFTQNPVVPQAASSQYVQVPGNKGMNPALINNITGLAKPVLNTLNPLNITGIPNPVNPNQPVTTASSVFAPNVGSYGGSGTDDDADDSTDDSKDDGTGTGETEEERRRRLAAQNEQSQDNNYDPTTAATTRFGGTVENGRIRGGKTYNIGYESSTAKPGTGMLGALMNIGNLDQVRITDPETGKSVAMSRETYNKMTKDRTNPNNISFISDLIERQDAINYNRDRASKIAPFKTGLAVAGENILGIGNAPGLSLAEQNKHARSLANSLGIEYTGQSMAEMLALEQISATKTSQGLPLSPVFTRDAQGNLVRDTSYDTPQGLNTSEAAYGAGQFSGAPAQPIAVDSFAGPYTQPTLGLAAPTTEADRLAQSVTPAGNTVAYTPDEAARLASFAAPTRDTRAVAMSMPNQKGIGDPSAPQSTTPLSTDLRGFYNAGNITRTDLERIAAGEPSFNRPVIGPDGKPRTNSLGQPIQFEYQQFDNYDKRMAEQQAARNLLDEVSYDDLGLATNDQIRASDRVSQQMRDSGFTPSPGEAQRAGERRGERAAYQASLFEDDFETPDNQGADMDDDAPSASYDMSTREGRKAAADDEAQEQTGKSTSRAVTDSSGRAVRGTDGSVVTSEEPSGTAGTACVIATHAVANNGFSHDVKREAVRWCVKNLHKRWYGEAVRRGYRYHGIKAIEAGRAHNHYEEFQDYIDFATGKKRSLTNLGTFVYRTAQFFITGLFVK